VVFVDVCESLVDELNAIGILFPVGFEIIAAQMEESIGRKFPKFVER